MKYSLRTIFLLASLAAIAAHAQISQFQHIIVVFQENRTPDNLFYALCDNFPCSTTPNNSQYNIQTSNWLDKTSPSGLTQPIGVTLGSTYPLQHTHNAWKAECDINTNVNPPQCRMDGAAGTSPKRGAFAYVANSVNSKFPNGEITPYLTMATDYGWANFMFQTNQGPSYPAHQFIFGGTSALSAEGDAQGSFLSENFTGPAGCYAETGESTVLLNSSGLASPYVINWETGVTACLTRVTMADLLDNANVNWKYYSFIARKTPGTDGGNSIWTAPNTIEWICQPNSDHKLCTGPEWAAHVDLTNTDVFNAMGLKGGPCDLAGVSWVIPIGANSDHGGGTGGPDWVASIANTLGNSPCKNPDGSSYWNTTAIVVTWDDFGGWYDHVQPPILPPPQGAYQMGFRVPLIFISAYTPAGYIENQQEDFGSILRFIENNFDLGEGALGFADSRSTTDLSTFYNLNREPRPFVTIPTMKSALDFVNDKTPPEPPDED